MKIKFFSSRPYEEDYLIKANLTKHEISFETASLSTQTVDSTIGFEAISAFTNDDLSADILKKLKENGVNYIALRSTGYDHIDLKYAAENGIKVANVPEYSPYSVAEHAVTMMLTLNRKIIQTDQQVKKYNFTLNNLIGFDMNNKTVGIVGMGKIGQVIAKILNGFGCKILAFDIDPKSHLTENYNVTYCSKKELFEKSDIITLNCPLTEDTHYTINKESLTTMKNGVMIINCGRGGLINTSDALDGLKIGKIGYLGLDVYEKEKGLFFYDHSQNELKDTILLELMNFKNVLITPHQAFLTSTALKNIADTTFYNIDCFAQDKISENELT